MSHQKEVETILEKGSREGVVHYLVKWKGSDRPEDNSWEPLTNMDCQDLVDEFEAKLKTQRKSGFARGLTPEKIIGATKKPGELYLVVKVRQADQTSYLSSKFSFSFHSVLVGWY